MRATLLTTEQSIYKFTNLSGNLDVDKLTPFIKTAQDTNIEPVLGTKLYLKLLDEVDAGTLAGDYLTLVTDYVQPCLIWFAMSEMYLFHGYEVANAGVLRNIPQDKQLPELSELNTLVQRARDKADLYRERLIDYLCYYPNLFPEYTQNQEDGKYPSTDNINYYPGLNL